MNPDDDTHEARAPIGPWAQHAACRPAALNLTPRQAAQLMHPVDQAGAEEAQAICRGCPVREDCLEHAITNHEDHGIWGGLSERARRRERRRRQLGGVA